MKPATAIRLRIWLGGALALGLVLCFGTIALRPVEPVWRSHRLSEWLEAYDSSLRFDEGDGRRSRFRDAEIDQALESLGPAALPFLRKWITAKPNRVKAAANRLLNRQSWVSFRFREHRDWQSLAQIGFMFYGADAQPLLPELLELAQSRDAEIREYAYEAAFFTRPDRAIFLPLATRAFEDPDWSVRAMAAQWMRERFPDDANRIGLDNRSLLQFVEQPATNSSSNEP